MARFHLPAIALLVVLAAPLVLSVVNTPIPEDKSQLEAWFKSNVKSLAYRKGTLDPELEAAEAKPRVIKVRTDGSGEFKTIMDAIKSVPTDNKQRVIISLGPGEYKEKVTIDRYKPFITLYGEGTSKPNLTFAGTAAKYGTVYSATLTVESNYFMAINIGIVNSAPKPDGKTVGAQGLAMRIGGDKAAFYRCNFYGFQDTLCDDAGNHFFKDCFIQGTYDFIFGSGTSLYLNTHLHAVGDGLRVITAQAGDPSPNTGYAFVHGTITGTGKGVFLGRAWKDSPEVVYAYTDMSGIVDPTGWKDSSTPGRKSKALYGEYKCSGAGAQKKNREFVRQMEPKEAAPYLNLGYIRASKWLLPPHAI